MKNDKAPPDAADRRRLIAIALFLSLLFCLLVARFYQIQIVEGEKWMQVALSQHQSIIVEPFTRGSFYSNTSMKEGHPEEKQPLVLDVQKFHLFIDPESILPWAKEEMVEALYSLLRVSERKKANLYAEFDKKSRSRRLASWLDRETKERIEAWWSDFSRRGKIARNALFFIPDYKRSYPFGSMLGAVLHTVQEERDPKTSQALPTGGLEMSFHSYLQGKLGRRLITHSPRHPLDTGKILEAPENGADIYLTINHYLQAVAEAELAKGVQASRARGGWAVMMDPNNGEIWALAQYPAFDPEKYAHYFNDPTLQEWTRVKAVSDCFEPGSIMKPITAAICLRANEELARRGKKPLFTPEEKIAVSNGWFPGRTAPLKDGRVVHSYLNMDLALQKSSNIYMGRLVHRLIEALGEGWYRQALAEIFGFGQRTGIELPAESGGLLPTPGKLHPNGKLEWSLPTPYSLAIGHNILINSIQVTRAYAIFANGGFAVQPHIVQKIVKKRADGAEEIIVDKSSLPRKQILNRNITERVVRSMKFVTKEGGTARRGDIRGYTEACKSGTAEKILGGVYSKEHHISSFIGFAPVKNPRFVLIVTLDDPEVKWIPGVGKHQLGGVSAAPIFRDIAEKTLQYLGIAPDDPYGYPLGDPRRDSQKADWAAEVNALKQLYQAWNSR